MSSFTFVCKFSCICYFSTFVLIFMKFSSKCRAKKLGMIHTIWEVFAYFELGKGPIFGPRFGPGRSLFTTFTWVKIFRIIPYFMILSHTISIIRVKIYDVSFLFLVSIFGVDDHFIETAIILAHLSRRL